MGDAYESGIRSDAVLAGELLNEYVAAGSDADASVVLSNLFEDHLSVWCAQTSRRTLRSYGLRGGNQADEEAEISAEVMLQLTVRLQAIRAGTAPLIENLRAYAVSAVYNACFGRIRARCPQHVQLQNRVRYLLRNDVRFAVWTCSGGEQLAGLRVFQGMEEHVQTPETARTATPLPGLLQDVLAAAGGAVRLSDLIGVIADALGVVESSHEPVDGQFANGEMPVDRIMIEQEGLASLWKELLLLPGPQRSALLLNLRDAGGTGVIELIPATGTASFGQLAVALGMQTASLALLWNELPMEDSQIAALLGVTRQQVINLRKSARERLARRRRIKDGNTRRSLPSDKGDTQSVAGKLKAIFHRL